MSLPAERKETTHQILPKDQCRRGYVSFQSDANNLVTDDTNGMTDVFVYDRQLNTTECVSLAVDGTTGYGKSSVGGISADGRYVSFASDANNLVLNDTNGMSDVFVFDRQTHTIERVARWQLWPCGPTSVQTAATYRSRLAPTTLSLATPMKGDIFVYDRDNHLFERVSLASDGTQATANRKAARSVPTAAT